MRLLRNTTTILILFAGMGVSGFPQTAKNDIPVIDAGMGPCTADVQVFDSGHHPMYKAEISTRIRYGFAGIKKLDLEIGTNVDGKARFTGLPEKARDMLQFTGDFQGRSNTVTSSPEETCHANLSIFLPDKPVVADDKQ